MTLLANMTKPSGANKTKTFVLPAIALDRPDKKEYDKSDLLSLKLRSNPANDNSQTYKLTVPFFAVGLSKNGFSQRKTSKRSSPVRTSLCLQLSTQ